jgi:hypothetical protein
VGLGASTKRLVTPYGAVAERLIAPVLKTGVRLRGPGVQIPPAPRRVRGGMADAPDLGSGTLSVRVQVPPSPLE